VRRLSAVFAESVGEGITGAGDIAALVSNDGSRSDLAHALKRITMSATARRCIW
jgi:hypothetical protein